MRGGGGNGRGGACGDRALGPVHGHQLAVTQQGGGVASPDHCRDTELARDDGGVARHPAAVGHDRRGSTHGGHPVGTGHGRHQDLARLQLFALVGRLQKANHTRGPAGRCGEALDEQRSPLGAGCAGCAGRAAHRGDRSRLDDVAAAGGDRPFGVLGRAVVRFGRQSDAGQFDDIVVGQDPTATLGGIEVDPPVFAVGPAHDLERLHPDPDVQQPRSLLRHEVGVGLDLTAHDHLALAERSLDHDVIRFTRRRVDGEHHAGALRGHHLLHHDGNGRLRRQIPVAPIEDGTGSPQGDPTVDDAAQQLFGPGDVGERLVHAGERRALGVLPDAGGAHGHPDVVTETPVRACDVRSQLRGDRDTVHKPTRLTGQAVEVPLRRVPRLSQDVHQTIAHTRPVDGVEVRRTSDDKAGWDRESSRRQLTEVRTLATDQLRVLEADLFEPQDELRLHDSHLRPLSSIVPDHVPLR
jgi:hypothetical protein